MAFESSLSHSHSSSAYVNGPQHATFSYFHFNPAVHDREKPYEIQINLPELENETTDFRRSNEEFENHDTVVFDVRGREQDFSLDQNGVCWRIWEGPREWSGLDADGVKEMGNDWIRTVYVKAVESFIKTEIEKQDGKPVDTVKVFDYRLRTSKNMKDFDKRTLDLDNGLDTVVPVIHPHVDQSFDGALARIRLHMGDDAAQLQRRRFRIINVWKPLSTVTTWPLAICDTATVRQEDLIATDLVRRKYVGETFYSLFKPDHRWYYLSNQEPNEVTMLKIHDSRKSANVRFSLHSSFKPHASREEDTRESFEIRALVFDAPEGEEMNEI